MLLIFICIFLVLSIIIFFRLRNKKKRKSFKLQRKNLYKWMNMTKKERFNNNVEQSKLYLNKRKNLLNQIRKEYKNISNDLGAKKK